MPGLFIVGKQPPEELIEEPDPVFEATGEAAEDLETALRALSFLLAWMNEVGPEGLAACADGVRRFREERAHE